jgi:hypothetical protein
MKTRPLAFLLLVVPVVLTGCANVQPWERAALADYTVVADRDPLTEINAEHMWFSREATSGGRGVGGGGCGCN